MVDPIPFEEQAKALKLRNTPRPIAQINRKVVLVLGGGGAVVLAFLAILALDPPKLGEEEEPRELYNTRNKPTADALAALPASYEDYRPAPPVLGPPVVGDLGGAFLMAERELDIEPDWQDAPVGDLRPDPESEAERAERIRQAKLVRESLESPVFFRVGGGDGGG